MFGAEIKGALPYPSHQSEMERVMREFDTGATRDSDDGKFDYEGFLSPYALQRYAEYMHKHRTQADGKLRDSDNWQKGIPLTAYMKSLWRHLVDLWTLHRTAPWPNHAAQDALCAIIFNAMGYLHEITKPTGSQVDDKDIHPLEDIKKPYMDNPEPGQLFNRP